MIDSKKKKEKSIVVNDIQLHSIDRSRKDIQDWKSAMITAESIYHPNRTRLYDTYFDILIDGHLTGIINKRFDAVLNKSLYFKDKNGDRIEEMDGLIQHRDFRKLMRTIMETILWGISGIEFLPGGQFDYHIIPRKHIKPKWNVISYQQNGTEGIPYKDKPNIWVIGEENDLGLLLKCAPYALLKRGNMGDWAQFIEIFGRPVRMIKYDAFDKQAKVELREVLNESGGSLSLLIPKTADFEMLDGKTSNANGDLQNKFANSLNDELSICVLGNTETTANNNGGSNAKAQTQRQEQLEITKSDLKYVLGALNSDNFLKILATYGYKVAGGCFAFEREIDIDTVIKQLDAIQRTKSMNVPVDDSHIYKITGIPKPTDYKSIKSNSKKKQNNPITKKPLTMPDGSLLFEDLIAMDGFNASGLIERIANGKSKLFDEILFGFYTNALTNAFKIGWNSGQQNLIDDFGFIYDLDDPPIITAFETNLFQFSAAKTLKQVRDLNQLFRESKGFSDFKSRAPKVNSKYQHWMRTEYQTAVSVGESTAQYYRLKKKAEIFPYWKYKTAGDGRVRPSHRALNGLILPADDPAWNNIYPPNDWNCRCRVAPLTRGDAEGIDFSESRKNVEDYKQSAEFRQSKANGFAVNRAETGQVFTQNQFYTRKFPRRAKRQLGSLNYQDYGLKHISKVKTHGKINVFEGNAEKYYDDLERIDGKSVLRDAKKRPIFISEDVFKVHSTDFMKRRAYRTKYINAMESTLANPDEIWLNNQGTNNFTNYSYIKHFDDVSINVAISLDKYLGLNLKTWFPIQTNKNIVNKYRRGLLVYKKAP